MLLWLIDGVFAAPSGGRSIPSNCSTLCFSVVLRQQRLHRAKEAPEHIKAIWPGSSCTVEVITSTTTRKGKRDIACHRFITNLRTTPEGLLRLVRQRWSIENQWHWVRDTQLGEDAHRYANRTDVGVFSFLRTVVMNLLSRGGYGSIRQGFRELAYDIKGMLALGGVTTSQGTA
jgi:predicted transposase YbfD/YdcC